MLVATVLTVYGIETNLFYNRYFDFSIFVLQQYLPFTVLKLKFELDDIMTTQVATVLTVYGIETRGIYGVTVIDTFELQQYLPFTVLKLS